MLKYIEKCTGTNHDGPAWIGYVRTSKSGRTVYFNGRALSQVKGGGVVGNHIDVETGELYWISGVKRDGTDRHWAGSGPVTIEARAVDEYLALRGLSRLDPKKYRVCSDIKEADIERLHKLKTSLGKSEAHRSPKQSTAQLAANTPPNKPLKLTAEQVSAIDPRCRSGFPGVGRPW